MQTLYLLVFMSIAFGQVQPKLPTQEEMKNIEKDYQKVFQQALGWKTVREFREIFPTKTVGLSGYRVPSVKHTVFGQTALYSRYVLRFSLDVKFNKTWTKIVDFGSPEFQLNEVERIQRTEDGRFYITYGSQRRFGEKEWKLLYQARGDFRVLGIHLERDQPIPQFDEYRQQVEPGWYPAL